MALPSPTEYHLFCRCLEELAFDPPSMQEGLVDLLETLELAQNNPYPMIRR